MGIQFSPEIFFSEPQMKQFFQGDTEAAQIRQRMTELQASPPTGMLYSRWEVVWIVIKTGAEVPLMVFFQATVYICKGVGAESLSRRCTVIVKQMVANLDILQNYWTYGEKFLVSAVNGHAPGTEDVYLQPMLRFDRFGPGQLYGNVLQQMHPNPDGFDFMVENGICQGMGDWYMYLFNKTFNPAANPRAHLMALAEQYSQGATRQASVLHSIYFWKTSYLNLQFEHERVLTQHGDMGAERIEQNVRDLGPGAYAIYTVHHRMNYFKYSDGTGFLLEPNKGLIAVTPQDFAAIALEHHHPDDARSNITIQRTLA